MSPTGHREQSKIMPRQLGCPEAILRGEAFSAPTGCSLCEGENTVQEERVGLGG